MSETFSDWKARMYAVPLDKRDQKWRSDFSKRMYMEAICIELSEVAKSAERKIIAEAFADWRAGMYAIPIEKRDQKWRDEYNKGMYAESERLVSARVAEQVERTGQRQRAAA